MFRFIKNIKRGISYFKQGYKSNDWDWGYLMEDLIFKLKRMERTIRNNQLIVEADAVGDEIKEVYELLDKVKEEDYEFDDYENTQAYDRALQDDLCKAFRLIEKNIRRWWD